MQTKKTKIYLSLGIFIGCLIMAFITENTLNSYLFAGIATAAGAYTSNHFTKQPFSNE